MYTAGPFSTPGRTTTTKFSPADFPQLGKSPSTTQPSLIGAWATPPRFISEGMSPSDDTDPREAATPLRISYADESLDYLLALQLEAQFNGNPVPKALLAAIADKETEYARDTKENAEETKKRDPRGGGRTPENDGIPLVGDRCAGKELLMNPLEVGLSSASDSEGKPTARKGKDKEAESSSDEDAVDESDYALALKLQTELNDLEYAINLQRSEDQKSRGQSKVFVGRSLADFASPYSGEYPALVRAAAYDSDDDDKDYGDADCYDDYCADELDSDFDTYGGVYMGVDYSSVGMKPAHAFNKPGGRTDKKAFEKKNQQQLHGAISSSTSDDSPYNMPVSRGSNGEEGEEFVTKHDPKIAAMQSTRRMEAVEHAGDMKGISVTPAAYNRFSETYKRKMKVGRGNKQQKAHKDRSTHDSVLDKSTRLTLYKLINNGTLESLGGIISTGKESHVYHAIGGDCALLQTPTTVQGEEYALKIYNMDLRRFKDRTKYVDGEYRFRHTPTNNARKVIKVWAEKEVRNLKRLKRGGVQCPEPVLLKGTVLVMTFVGKRGIPAPRLKDIRVSQRKMQKLYTQCVLMMRRMYQKCRLVHADLSEYNMLYFRKKLWFIDVSQSVESDHANAARFLRRDCTVVTKFFGRNAKQVLGTRMLFDFVVDRHIPEGWAEKVLLQILKRAESNGGDAATNKLFENTKTHIPVRLSDIQDPTHAIEDAQMRGDSIYGGITGLQSVLSELGWVPGDDQIEEQSIGHEEKAELGFYETSSYTGTGAASSSDDNCRLGVSGEVETEETLTDAEEFDLREEDAVTEEDTEHLAFE